MTDQEALFQAMLDANPEDHQTRMVLGDYLEEIGDVRGAGYRALGVFEKTPLYVNGNYSTWWYCVLSQFSQENVLEGEWWHRWKDEVGYDRPFGNIRERQEAEDAAALAFSKLPQEHQNQLLGVGVSV